MPPPISYAPRPWTAVLGMAAVALGFLGLLFFWLLPLGLILAAAGFLLGISGWIVAVTQDREQPGMIILGTILSLIALVVDTMFVTGGITYLITSLRGY